MMTNMSDREEQRPPDSATLPVPPAKPSGYVCEVCGVDRPVDQVFQCTICLKYFCVNHVGPWLHDCYTNE